MSRTVGENQQFETVGGFTVRLLPEWCPAGAGFSMKTTEKAKKEVCGMWFEMVIPYMVKSGRSDQLDQWERDWYEENIRRKSGNA